MESKAFSTNRFYTDVSFIVSDKNITRVVEVASERLKRLDTDVIINQEFKVRFKNNKVTEVDALEKVLTLDNTKKNPIKEVEIDFTTPTTPYGESAISVFFNGRAAGHLSIFGENTFIRLKVASTDALWVEDSVEALEEQIERTIITGAVYWLKKNAISFFFICVLISSLYGAVIKVQTNKIGFAAIDESQVSELMALQTIAKSQQEKIDFIFQYLSATIPKNDAQPIEKYSLKEPKTYFIAVPLVIAGLSTLWAIAFCYPTNVFAWGDCAEELKKKIERRKLVWNAVVFSLAIGVLGNLFAFALTA